MRSYAGVSKKKRTFSDNIPRLAKSPYLEHIPVDCILTAIVLRPLSTDNTPCKHQQGPACEKGRDKIAGDADKLVADHTGGGGDDTVDERSAAHDIGQIGGR